MLLRRFPDVHVRRRAQLCITVLISSSNPVAVIRIGNGNIRRVYATDHAQFVQTKR
jgi:hypothetical protein